jgi:hypothetical protein
MVATSSKSPNFLPAFAAIFFVPRRAFSASASLAQSLYQ